MGLLVPRLWPCFRHALASVRRATVQCLAALLPDGPGTQPPSWLRGEQLLTALRLSFQNLVMEEDAGILLASQRLWSRLMQAADPAALAGIPPSVLEVGFLALCSIPRGGQP